MYNKDLLDGGSDFMLLYLVQHGEAGKEEEDPKRGLSNKGIHDVEKIAAYLQKLPVRVNEIYHSAKPRAQQTAAILAQHLKPDKGINQADNLLPMDDPGLWAMRIKGMEEDMMVVGHRRIWRSWRVCSCAATRRRSLLISRWEVLYV